MTTVTLHGNPFKVEGTLPAAGAAAPALTLTNGELADVTLANYAGKRKVLNIVPSLDTPTCATSTRKFNEKAASLNNAVVLVVSADLPFAAGRFCATEGLKNVAHLCNLPPSRVHGRLGREDGRRPAAGRDRACRGRARREQQGAA